MNQWNDARKAVLETAREMLNERLFIGMTGNVSLRLASMDNRQLLAITPSSRDYTSLQVDDIVVMDFTGQRLEGSLEPSMETPLHTAIYRTRQDVNAVIHTHSLFASAVAVVGREIPPILEDQVVFLGGAIKQVEHTHSDSKQQLTGVLEALGDRNAVILSNHGAVGTGHTLRDAANSCRILEKTARIFLLALSTGTVNELPAPAVKALKAMHNRLQSQPLG